MWQQRMMYINSQDSKTFRRAFFKTLRNGVSRDINPECRTMGATSLFILDVKARLLPRRKETTRIRFVHGRQDVVNMASQFAMYRNKWKRTNQFSSKWP
jgi:hypothetical protein